jgi:hypothetical protein
MDVVEEARVRSTRHHWCLLFSLCLRQGQRCVDSAMLCRSVSTRLPRRLLLASIVRRGRCITMSSTARGALLPDMLSRLRMRHRLKGASVNHRTAAWYVPLFINRCALSNYAPSPQPINAVLRQPCTTTLPIRAHICSHTIFLLRLLLTSRPRRSRRSRQPFHFLQAYLMCPWPHPLPRRNDLVFGSALERAHGRENTTSPRRGLVLLPSSRHR